MNISGVVEKVVERPGKYGSMYSMKVDNTFYGTKGKKPPCKEGDYVTFEATQSDKGYWDANPDTIKGAINVAGKAAETTPPATRAWVPDTDRQNSIIYQSSRKDALELVGVLLQNNLIDLGKAKKADAIELVEGYVDRYTLRFYEDTRRLSPVMPDEKAEEEFKDDIPF